jgi:flagellar motor switch protein FliG
MKRQGKPPRGIAEYQRTLEQKAPPGEGLLKSPAPLPRPPAAPPEGGDSKYRRVARFLILIGSEEAARILATLEPAQVERISGEIASIRGITAEEAERVFAEFRGEFRSLLPASAGYGGTAAGGLEAARRLLYAAFGPEKGESLLTRAVPEARKNPFDFLENLSGEDAFLLLREESPGAAAMVLSRLSPRLSAACLAKFSSERKAEIARRIARMGRTPPEALEGAAAALREKARRLTDAGGKTAPSPDGKKVLASILKHADYSFGDRILEELEEKDPDLSRDLKERLYTLEDVVKAEDRALQEKLRTMTDRDLVLLLKGRSPEFTEKILSNISANRRTLLREEAELMGPVLKKETDALVRDFMAWFRLGRETGNILLIDDEDVIV